jgi:tetratricopeptide (TPR) repeat protein
MALGRRLARLVLGLGLVCALAGGSWPGLARAEAPAAAGLHRSVIAPPAEAPPPVLAASPPRPADNGFGADRSGCLEPASAAIGAGRRAALSTAEPSAAAAPLRGRFGSGSSGDLPRLFEQALAASRDGRFAEALPLWERVLELAPRDAAAWSNRGNVRLALGDAEGAIADQERAMQLDPANPDPHLNRGTAEEALGRWDAAAADYGWILERDGGDAAALYNLGNVAGSRGDWQQARRCFRAAAEARPGFAMARSSAALAAFQLGELEPAERELRALIRRYPLFADARAGLTALLWQRRAGGEAESHWAAASGLDSRYRQEEWLLRIRRWPPGPVQALQQFLHLAS